MLSNNSDEVLVIPTTNNEWTQTTMIDDHHNHHNSHHKVASSSSSSRVMEKAGQELLQQALKCPRCDSSNTKFCYYNNYSLSQPRHFCKACKRYWTRGGTLRNVPVGGGCRKNKRLKRHSSSSSSSSTTPTTASPPPPPPSNSNLNPLLHGLPSSTSNISTGEVINNNFAFPGFSSIRVSGNSGYDLHQSHHLNNVLGGGGGGGGGGGLALISSGIMSSEASDDNNNNGNGGGFGTSNNGNNTAFLSAYNSIFGSGSSSNCSPTNPVMASLLSSTLLQHKFMNGSSNVNAFHQLGLGPLQESEAVMAAAASKEVKGEGKWNPQMDHHNHVAITDPSLYWNTSSATTALGAAWTDNQTNIGPSLTSLI